MLATPYGVNKYAGSGYYFIEYPEDIQLYGVSFNTQLGTSGWALQGEYSFRNDVPLQIEEASLIAAGLAPFTGCLGVPLLPQEVLDQLPANFRTTAGCVQGGGFHRTPPATTPTPPVTSSRKVSQVQATATRVFGPTLGADGFVFLTEAALLQVHSMPAKSTLRLESPAEGSPSDATSMGYRIAARLDYNNAVGSANLFPYLQFQHDVSGNSPQPIGPFVEGRTALTLGLRVSYLSRWEGNVSYTAYAGKRSEIRDRDLVTATIKFSF